MSAVRTEIAGVSDETLWVQRPCGHEHMGVVGVLRAAKTRTVKRQDRGQMQLIGEVCATPVTDDLVVFVPRQTLRLGDLELSEHVLLEGRRSIEPLKEGCHGRDILRSPARQQHVMSSHCIGFADGLIGRIRMDTLEDTRSYRQIFIA